MAYTPVGWQTGDTITAERLNRMDRGWSVDSTQLFSETVTTAGDGPYEGQFAYMGDLTAGTITVTYDGTEYVCPSIGAGEYGAPYIDDNPDFSVYPFNLLKNGDTVYLTTQTAGEHTVAASVTSAQTSADFDKARGYGYVTGSPTELFSETVSTVDQDGMYGAQLAYSDTINADSLTVTFDGTEYTCPRIDASGHYYYYGGFGEQGPTFTEYPFYIASGGLGNMVFTETASTHTITVAATVMSMQTSADFAKAVADVASALPVPFKVTAGITTWQQLTDAMLSNRLAYIVNSNAGGAHACLFVDTYIGTDNCYYATAISVSSRTTSFTTMRFKAASSDSLLELA